MGQLFTVKMIALKIVTKYDTKGVKVSETTIELPQTYHDLPYQTALTYKTKFPDNKVEIVAQHGEFGAARQDGVSRPSARPSAPRRTERASTPVAPAKSASARAAETGDLSAALNAELGS